VEEESLLGKKWFQLSVFIEWNFVAPFVCSHDKYDLGCCSLSASVSHSFTGMIAAFKGTAWYNV
jgi:hypothetical protein